MARRLAGIWVALLVLGAASAACGDDDARLITTAARQTTTTSGSSPTTTTTPPQTTTTSAPATTTTTSPPTTTTTSTTTTSTSTTTTSTSTTTTAPFPCPGSGVGPIPGGVLNASVVGGDLDGDGFLDDFFAYQAGDGAWYLHARLGPGYTTNLLLDADFESTRLGGLAVGPVRVDNVVTLGFPEEFAVVQLGIGLVAYYGIFAVEDCAIVPLLDGQGRIPDLWVGGGLGGVHLDSPICGPDNQVHQAIFGAGAGCPSLEGCAELTLSQTSYLVERNPARLEQTADGFEPATPDVMAAVLGRSCIDPATP